jgi:hypothetical protein
VTEAGNGSAVQRRNIPLSQPSVLEPSRGCTSRVSGYAHEVCLTAEFLSPINTFTEHERRFLYSFLLSIKEFNDFSIVPATTDLCHGIAGSVINPTMPNAPDRLEGIVSQAEGLALPLGPEPGLAQGQAARVALPQYSLTVFKLDAAASTTRTA